MRALSLLALLPLVLAGCLDQGPAEPIPIDEPSFYNSGGNYWQVTKLDDTDDHTCDADCSLREAIEDAASGDEIRFGVTGTITLTATLQISKGLTITGPGASQMKVSGDDAYRVFNFGPGVTATLSGLTIADGAATEGGGIAFSTGTLTITNCVVSGNQATNGGGGVYNLFGTLTITRSTISGNSASAGGGIATFKSGGVTFTESTISGNSAGTGGGIYNYNTILTLERSTLSGNIATGSGGGVWSQTLTIEPVRPTTFLNSTISGNSAANGGGIYNFNGITRILLSTVTDNSAASRGGGVISQNLANARTDVKGSIIWGNTGSGATADDVSAVYAVNRYNSMGYNLIGARSWNVDFSLEFRAAGDHTGVTDALLGGFELNGPGTTRTHALIAGSPAIDAGTCTDHAGAPVGSDQRGVTRPQGITCDIGAYELSPEEAVESLMEQVKALGPGGTGTLNKGQTNSLLVTLDVVVEKLANGQNHVALNNLWAFIDKVETLTAGAALSTAEGQPLIGAAEQIIAAIEAM